MDISCRPFFGDVHDSEVDVEPLLNGHVSSP